ncbi:MAG TPA: protein kinase [Longimicrobiaceae bacterium]|nr:protein kinase [Longimicrobiaceae bacterium]
MSGLEDLLAGRVLGGRYLIEEVIGRGGMGAVYRAVDERLGRPVAVKVITAVGAGEAEARERLRARFNREARAAAALPHHPNVVPVYDYGTDEQLGLDYIVMELLRGSDLSTRLARSGPPQLANALRILLQAARGIAIGHRAGLIHRDVKPGNIFLVRSDDGEVQVRVVDFGIAKLTDEEDTNQLTQDGRAPHSPAFASPEQLRGLSQLTPASDVFSLGAVGFLLLTGERPYSEEDRNKMSLGMPVPPPSLRDLNPAIPAGVEEVVQKALAFDPADRYPDAGAFAAALDRAVHDLSQLPVDPYADEPVVAPLPGEEPMAEEDDRTHLFPRAEPGDHTLLAPEPPPAERAPPSVAPVAPRRHMIPPRRRRGSAAPFIWAFVILALAAVAFWAYWLTQGPGRRADLSGAPADSTAQRADSIARADSARRASLDAAMATQEGTRLFNAGDITGALRQYERALQLAPDDARYLRNYALALLRSGQPERAEQELRKAIQLAPTYSVIYANLAQAQLAQFDTAAAIASLEHFVQISTSPALTSIAQRELRELRAQQATGGLLGVPLDTATRTPDTVHINIPPGPVREDTLRPPGGL